MTEDGKLARIDVLSAHKDACRLHGVRMEPGVKAMLLAWCRDEPVPHHPVPEPPPDFEMGVRRREACAAAIREADRRGIEIDQEILVRMVKWSWER